MVTRMKDPVRNENKITTIDALDKRGLIEYHEVKSFWGGRRMRIAYFADIKGTTEGWEIGKMAFLSRTHSPMDKEGRG